MQVRRLLTAGIWLATTVAATAMVWTATSVVASDVTDRPPPVIAHSEVVQALQEDAPGDETTPAVTTPTSATSIVPLRPAPTAPVVGPSVSQSPEPATLRPPPPPVTTTTAPATANSTPPSTTPRPVDPTTTISTTGGVVTAACSGYFIRFVAATPTDGYAVDVLDRGPATVDVHFVAPGEEVRVRLVCFGGRPIRIPDQHEEAGGTSGRP